MGADDFHFDDQGGFEAGDGFEQDDENTSPGESAGANDADPTAHPTAHTGAGSATNSAAAGPRTSARTQRSKPLTFEAVMGTCRDFVAHLFAKGCVA